MTPEIKKEIIRLYLDGYDASGIVAALFKDVDGAGSPLEAIYDGIDGTIREELRRLYVGTSEVSGS